jgi:alkylation response protein AidB-like acyl-CoA dehydrogenase
MDLTFTPEEEDFRLMVREWIADNLPEDIKKSKGMRASVKDRHRWYKLLAEKGWHCMSWPKEYGGPGWSLAQQYIFSDEAGKMGAPNLSFGVTMIGPLIIECGDDWHKERFLPKIASAEEIWCQGYSEPNAGSDLASLSLKAEKQGGEYILNGQKVWTSYADEASWIFLLGRTNTNVEKRQEGISFFVAPMDSEGIELRPIKQITDEAHFFETFFENVRIPEKYRIGPENGGWTLGKRLLTYERVSTGNATYFQTFLDRLVHTMQTVQVNGHVAMQDPALRQKLGQVGMELDALRALGFRSTTQLLQGNMPGPESSLNKLFGTEMFQHITDLAQEVQGPLAMLWDDPNHQEMKHLWAKTAAGSRAHTIFGGTSEIQRNIISERVLGMPR